VLVDPLTPGIDPWISSTGAVLEGAYVDEDGQTLAVPIPGTSDEEGNRAHMITHTDAEGLFCGGIDPCHAGASNRERSSQNMAKN